MVRASLVLIQGSAPLQFIKFESGGRQARLEFGGVTLRAVGRVLGVRTPFEVLVAQLLKSARSALNTLR